MDKSISNRLRELEARRTIIKNELIVQRDKLNRQKNKVMGELDHYRDIERRMEALYDEDERAADELIRFKLRNGLV